MGVSRTQVVKFIRKGDPGDKGEQGATLRGPQAWSDCAVGYAFQSGKEGEQWIDVVLYNNNYYTCKKSHTKTASNYPGSTTDQNNGYWQLGDKIQLVATKILLATYALIENLGVKYVEINSTDGYIKQVDPDGNAIFLVQNGNVTCNKGTFNNITVQSGTIGGFNVLGNDLSNEPFTNDASIIFRNDAHNTFAGIGGNVLPATTGVRAVARFENEDTQDQWGLDANYAAILSAKGSRTNVAMQINGGCVAGLALKTTVLDSTSYAIKRDDVNIVCLSDSTTTLTLPAMELYDDGHIIRIKRCSGLVNIKMNMCYTYNGTSSRKRYPALYYGEGKYVAGNDSAGWHIGHIGYAYDLIWLRDVVVTLNGVKYYGCWQTYSVW